MAETETKTHKSQALVDYMARDADSLLAAMRTLIPDKLPEWTDHNSEADFGNVLLQLFAHMGDILSYYQDRVATESFLTTARSRASVIDHLHLIGYRLATAAPASTNLQLSFPAAYTDVVTLAKRSAFATKSRKDSPSVRFEYLGQDLIIDCSALPVDAASGRKLYPDPIPVEEGRSVHEEILGNSDGRPNQRYPLAHEKLILRSEGLGAGINKDLVLITDLGGVIDVWNLQESLAFSREQQKDFVVEIDSQDRATIIFGDNAFGAIPAPGSVIKLSYRVGGGLLGNVPAATIETIIDAPNLALAGAQVSNPSAATGGAEREGIEQAIKQAPKVFRSLKRAVTAEDYEALALKLKAVGKVRARARHWNRVTLFIAPEGGGQVSDVLKSNLLAYFEDKRPLSTLIEIEDVDYVKILIAAEVGVQSYYSRADVREQVENAVGALLAFANVDFAQTVYLSKLYEAIEAIAGVEYVTVTEFRRADSTLSGVEASGKILLGENEIPRAADDPTDDAAYRAGIKLALKGGY